jgi:THO complex subunit 1
MPYRPGDVKDFVKKIKLEDARIDQRKKALARVSERIIQARAKANAASTSSPIKEPRETALAAPEALKSEAPSTLSPSVPLSEARSPLHPSLPAKPGAAAIPSKSGSPQETPAPAPNLTSAPPAVVAAASSPVPPAPPADEQIARLEEVGPILLFLCLHMLYDVCLQNKQRWSWLALRTARDQYLQYFGKIGTGDLILLQYEIEQGAEKDKLDREKIQKGEELSPGANASGIVPSATGAGEDHGASPLIIGGSLGGSENDGEKMTGVEDGTDTKVADAEVIKMEL